MRDWQAVQWAQRRAPRLGFIRFRSLLPGLLRHQGDDCVDLGVDTLDLLQVSGQRLARAQLLAANQSGHLDSAEKTDIRRRGLPRQNLRGCGGAQDLIRLAAGDGPVRHAEFYHLTDGLRRDKFY